MLGPVFLLLLQTIEICWVQNSYREVEKERLRAMELIRKQQTTQDSDVVEFGIIETQVTV